jgi:hypothetical protein
MSNAQAFLLGMIAAWTPCLLILAWFVRRAKLEDAPRTKQFPADSSSGGHNGSPRARPTTIPKRKYNWRPIDNTHEHLRASTPSRVAPQSLGTMAAWMLLPSRDASECLLMAHPGRTHGCGESLHKRTRQLLV